MRLSAFLLAVAALVPLAAQPAVLAPASPFPVTAAGSIPVSLVHAEALAVPALALEPVALTGASPYPVSAAGDEPAAEWPAFALAPAVSLPKASLPAPRAPRGPVVFKPARPLQVTTVALAPAPKPESPAAAPAPAATTPVPAASAKEAPAVSPAPAAATPAPAASAKPAAKPSPAPSASPRPSAAPVVKDPVPIRRTTAPVTTATPAPAASPAPSASPRAVAATGAAVSEPQLVTPPVQSVPALPPSSLPEGAQSLSGTQGQTVQIQLPGRGWMFVGTGLSPAGVSFMEKTVQQGDERFKFRLDNLGVLKLQFQRQDVATGLMEKQTAAVTVLARGTAPEPAVSFGASTGYQPEYPIAQERGAAKAVAPRTATPVSSAAPAAVPTLVVPPSAESMPADATGLLVWARQRDQAGQTAQAVAAYERLLKDFAGAAGSDEAMFRLARVYESSVELRNLKRAQELYVKLQADWPYSDWCAQAKERARYIGRTFLRQ